ncbi:MAG: glycosyltransferase family 4 protein [Firmicutes bacterium]|nr:glycosyltransferase family 4 protein [Bacillota bacterium]
MNILYIGYEGFDTNNGTNHLIESMLFNFLEHGNRVIYMNSHSVGVNNDIPETLQKCINFESFIINRKKTNKRNFIDRYLVALKYNSKLKKILKVNQLEVDIAIIQSTPTAYFTVNIVKKLIRIPIIFNSFDIFPDGLHKLNKGIISVVFKIMEHMQKKMYKKVDYIIANSEDVKKTYLEKNISAEKIGVVYNWFDVNKVKNKNRNDNCFVEANSIDTSKFIVQYAGNFGYTFDYEFVLNLANILKCNCEIVIHMIGEGAFLEEFKERAKTLSLGNLLFYPWQSSEIISDVYSTCDIELIPLAEKVIKFSYPSKTSLLMALGKVSITITENDSNYFKIMNSNKIGLAFEKNDIENIANQIIFLSKDEKLMSEMGINAVKYAESTLSSKVNLDLINKIIHYVIGSDKSNEHSNN